MKTLSPTIRIDDEVFEALKSHAEPFVDTPNSVLRRILGLGGAGFELNAEAEREGVQSGTTPHQAVPSQPNAAVRRSQRRVGLRTAGGTHSRARSKTKAPRARAGSILDDTAYEVPLLEILGERGGQAPAREVLEELGVRLSDLLTETDQQTLSSGSVRWKNRAQFVRLRLVTSGDMVKDSPRGLWELTDQGRKRVERRR